MSMIRIFLMLLASLAAPSTTVAASDALEVIAPDSAPADAVKVDIAKMKYAPANLEIEEGATVTWVNHDALPHNVQIGSPTEVVGDMLRSGQTMAITFKKAGDYNYVCTPHPFMKRCV